jgi:hypothetical protein
MTTMAPATPLPYATPTRPPYSRALQRLAGASLVIAGLLNGGGQYVVHLLAGDLMFSDLIRWGADNPVHGIEQALLVVSALVMPIGLLGVAHLCRFRAPRLTAVATPLVIWGMWGFATMLTSGYVAGTVAVDALSVDQAVALNESFLEDPGLIVLGLVPHLLGSFFGLLLLSIAAWRSRSFPRPALALLIAFLVWDFMLPPIGPLEAHLLLLVAWCWMGWHLFRTSDAAWAGVSLAQND